MLNACRSKIKSKDLTVHKYYSNVSLSNYVIRDCIVSWSYPIQLDRVSPEN